MGLPDYSSGRDACDRERMVFDGTGQQLSKMARSEYQKRREINIPRASLIIADDESKPADLVIVELAQVLDDQKRYLVAPFNKQ